MKYAIEAIEFLKLVTPTVGTEAQIKYVVDLIKANKIDARFIEFVNVAKESLSDDELTQLIAITSTYSANAVFWLEAVTRATSPNNPYAVLEGLVSELIFKDIATPEWASVKKKMAK